MAIDTAAKRASALNARTPFPRKVIPLPDGSVDDGDKQHLLGRYSGIAFAPAAPDTAMSRARSISRFIASRIFGRVN